VFGPPYLAALSNLTQGLAIRIQIGILMLQCSQDNEMYSKTTRSHHMLLTNIAQDLDKYYGTLKVRYSDTRSSCKDIPALSLEYESQGHIPLVRGS